jgi:hypothetical protein
MSEPRQSPRREWSARFGANRVTSGLRASSAQRIVHERRLRFSARLPVYVYL